MEISSDNESCETSFSTLWTDRLTSFTTNLQNDQVNEDSKGSDAVNYGYIDEKAMRMMSKMGFHSGSGLGRNNQGILEPVKLQSNLGRRGLGHFIDGLEPATLRWNPNLETIVVQEKVDWIVSSIDKDFDINDKDISEWIKIGPRKLSVSDETEYCDPVLLQEVLKAKEVFDELDVLELCKARSRANPFETLRSAFFMNRAALKMANIDAATGFMFTNVDKQKEHKQSQRPYYFADICAGPGGFSEYVFWRKQWAFKGFGMTLRGDHDFKVHESTCAPSETFEALYGVRDDGNVYYLDNIRDFCSIVKCQTGGLGLHFIMSDGGFSVEGQENLQEILSRQLYVCQCFIALSALRTNGHFVVKLFDLFTPFSVGLIYLMYRCFQKVAILKPNSSRPANSERYLLCSRLKCNEETKTITEYLEKIVLTLSELRAKEEADLDINEIVPASVIHSDTAFLNYITDSNNKLAKRQVVGLLKLATFCRDPTLIEPKQEELRAQCLAYWRVPDKPKAPLPHITTDELVCSATHNTHFMFSFAREISTRQELSEILEEADDWHYTFVASGKKCNLCNLYAGLGGNRVYRFQRNRWVRVKCIELVRGSIVFAELVKEYNSEDKSTRRSLHVIDALRLGETSLADLPYKERLDLISVYCQAVNRDSRSDLANIRSKALLPLSHLTSKKLPTMNDSGEWSCSLTTFSPDLRKYFYVSNALLLLKTDSSQSFNSTILSRTIIHLPSIVDFESDSARYMWGEVTRYLEQKSIDC